MCIVLRAFDIQGSDFFRLIYVVIILSDSIEYFLPGRVIRRFIQGFHEKSYEIPSAKNFLSKNESGGLAATLRVYMRTEKRVVRAAPPPSASGPLLSRWVNGRSQGRRLLSNCHGDVRVSFITMHVLNSLFVCKCIE